MVNWHNMPLNVRLWNYASAVMEGGFVVDDDNREALRDICDTIEKGESGLLLVGPPGTGKTNLLYMLQKITHAPHHPERWKCVTAKDISASFSTGGHEALRKYNTSSLVIDDLGYEQDGKHYGDTVNTIADVISRRYDLFVYSGIKTYFTTNLTSDQLTERYGDRIVDRLRGMCRKVILAGSSRRREQRIIGDLPEVFAPYSTAKPEEIAAMYAGWNWKPSEIRMTREAFKGATGNVNQTVHAGTIIKEQEAGNGGK